MFAGTTHLDRACAWSLRIVDSLAFVRGLLARGVPETARPFGGLVYRQALEHLHGARNEADTRALIAQENRRYARRQLIWFRKEPNLVWLQSSGERPETLAAVESILATWPNHSPASS